MTAHVTKDGFRKFYEDESSYKNLYGYSLSGLSENSIGVDRSEFVTIVDGCLLHHKVTDRTAIDKHMAGNLFYDLKVRYPNSFWKLRGAEGVYAPYHMRNSALGLICLTSVWGLYHLAARGLTKLNISRFFAHELPHAFWKKAFGGVVGSSAAALVFNKAVKEASITLLIDALQRKVDEKIARKEERQ